MNKFHLLIVLMYFSFLNVTINQCTPSSCLTDTINFSTAIDPVSGIPLNSSTSTTVVQDPLWILTGAPTNNGPVNLGSPAFVINTNSAWDDMPPILSPPSKYISAFPLSGSNEATPASTPYVFERKLCVCGSNTTVSFQDLIHVDNQVTLKLLGPGLGPGLTLSSYNSTVVSNFRNPPEDDGTINSITLLANSTYILRAEVINDNSGSPMGLNINGQLVADLPVLSVGNCCNNGAFISGYKFIDENCDGVQDSNEQTAAGWVIVLKDGLGNPIATTTTDQSGYYFFNINNPGNYSVEEQTPLPNGYSQTFPITPGSHAVTITGTEIVSNLNFGNCCPDCQVFQQSVSSINMSCNVFDDLLKINVGGIQPTDLIHLDINCDGIYEATGTNQQLNFVFPHYGVFDIKIIVERTLCDNPCELEILKTINIEETSCGIPECFEFVPLDIACIGSSVTSYANQIVVGGFEGLPQIVSYDGVSVSNFSSTPVQDNVLEVETFKGDIYAYSATISQSYLYKYNGRFWGLERSVPTPLLSGPAGNHAYTWNLPEMLNIDGSLFVAFLTNLPSGKTSHVLHQFDGTIWNVLSHPSSSFPGFSLERYFLVGEYLNQPMIFKEESNGTVEVNYLSYWDSVSSTWQNLSPAFQFKKSAPDFFYDGIFNVDHEDDRIVVVGNFDEMANVPGTKHVAQYNIAGAFWSNIGTGATAAPGIYSALNDVALFGSHIIVGGVGVTHLGGVPVGNLAWHDGVAWHSLGNAGLISDFHKLKEDNGACQLITVGECFIGSVQSCCIYDDLLVTKTETGPVYYKAHGKITTQSTITNTGDVMYNGGQGVVSLPPFNVQPGGMVAAFLDGCEDCCPDDPLADLPFLSPFVGNPNFAITQYTYNGDCIYQITDFCLVSDGTISYYDCLGNLICQQFQFGGTCPGNFTITNPVILQSC